jgi:heme oxygenase
VTGPDISHADMRRLPPARGSPAESAMTARTDRRSLEPRVGRLGRDAWTCAARTELRRTTADIHETLHRHRGFAELMQGSLTMPEYSRLLGCLYGFHHPLECAFRAMPAGAVGSLDLASREKAHLLRADLIAVGMSEAKINSLPLCPFLPEMRSLGDIVGCLYVVEGAGLGGNVIARRLDYLLGCGGVAGRRFFLGRPDPDPLPWSDFCQWLETCAQAGHLAEIVGSAGRCFEAIAKWLNRSGGGV